jgi:16S rRNA (guanine(966)-N(2))-methyltransferase RsmD
MIRIIAGSLKGKKIKSVRTWNFRPTQDRVKEIIFSKLGNVEDNCVIDLFAGTGNLGFEALSRGARKCIFVERDRRNVELIKSNAIALNVLDKIEIECVDVLQFLDHNADDVNIIFADPPYNYKFFNELFNKFDKLRQGTVIILEAGKDFTLPDNFKQKCVSFKVVGDTSLNFLKV